MTRVNGVSNVTEQDLRGSGKNRITALESRTLSPPPQSTFIREQSLGAYDANGSQRNRLYYSQAYGTQEQGVTVFYNQLSPGQIHRKSLEQLEYENGVLLEQLQERDEIITMYKSGWQPNSVPINDEIIKNLNLQLAQKNVLVEQFHRSLAQFE